MNIEKILLHINEREFTHLYKSIGSLDYLNNNSNGELTEMYNILQSPTVNSYQIKKIEFRKMIDTLYAEQYGYDEIRDNIRNYIRHNKVMCYVCNKRINIDMEYCYSNNECYLNKKKIYCSYNSYNSNESDEVIHNHTSESKIYFCSDGCKNMYNNFIQ